MLQVKDRKKVLWFVIGIITLAGFGLRFICCFYGYPYQLHPDEHTIVENAIDMLSRHSWEAYVYNRPDQFEIKCCAVLFQLFSYIKYHVPAYEAFAQHTGAFYFVARFFTALFGTALIPLGAMLAEKIFRKDMLHTEWIQIITAALFSFSYLFIQHSAFATPDIVLTFFFAAVAYWSTRYLEEGKARDIYITTVMMAIAVTIKYPAAIIAVYLAFLVIYRSVREKRYRDIWVIGWKCVGITIAVIFVTAPNLFTDIGTLVEVFTTEARNNHLGADGLGFYGNLKYYFKTIADSFGYVSMIAFVFGVIHLAIHRKKEHLPLLLNGIYWVLLSVLALHWMRWGFPMYIAYILLAASGFVWIAACCRQYIRKKMLSGCVRTVLMFAGLIGMINVLLPGISLTVWSSRQDVRIYSMGFCEEEGITTENSIYEGYTPLCTDFRSAKYKCFQLKEDGTVAVADSKPKLAEKEYLVISSSFKNRYRREPERYSKANAIYSGIDKTYELIYSVSGTNIRRSANEIKNIQNQVEYFLHGGDLIGDSIYIYRLTDVP